MGKNVLITSGKGGVGKSTLAVSLAAAFCARGMKIALVDGDVGLRCTDQLLGLQDQVVMDMQDVLEGQCGFDDALYPVRGLGQGDLYLLPASQALRAAQIRQKDMTRLLEKMRKVFDLVLIDGPAGIGRNFKLLLEGTDRCILVSTPDHVAMRDAEKACLVLEEKGLSHPDLILNRVRGEYVKAGLVPTPENLAERLDAPLLGVIPDSGSVYTALLKGTHPYLCGDRKFKAAVDHAAGRFLGENIPFPKLAFSPVYKFFHQI